MDYDYEPPPKPITRKLLTRLGRRNTHTAAPPQEDLKTTDDFNDGSLSPTSGKSLTFDGPVAPPRSRKTGWSDDLKPQRQRTHSISTSSVHLEQSHNREKHGHDDDIPVIPDLDEILEDNSGSDLSNAASNRKNRVATYKELDTDFLKKKSFATIDNIDLSLLAEKLYPEKMVQEADEVWNWDTIFTQISSEINSEARNNNFT